MWERAYTEKDRKRDERFAKVAPIIIGILVIAVIICTVLMVTQ